MTTDRNTRTAQAAKSRSTLRSWVLLTVFSYTAFIFNTTEFMPIGLLSDIAADFGVSEAHASLLISVYAWFVALMSLPLMLMVGKSDFRKMLLAVVGIFIVSHVASALSSSFAMLLVSRLGVACAHAVFWSIISPLALHVAPEGKRQTAMGMIITGTSLAMIAGMPIGRVIGLHLGWRASFGCIAGAALLSLLLIAALLPSAPNNQDTSLKSLPAVFRRPAITGIYVFTFLIAAAHYIGYSYIEPFLKQVAGMSDGLTTLSLTIFGVAGIGASVLFSKYYDKRSRLFLTIISVGMVAILLMLQPAAAIRYAPMGHCVLWGLTFMAFCIVTEFEIINHSSQYATIAVSIYSSIFNVGIGCGAFFGGMALTTFSISSIGYVGGLVATIAMVFAFKRLMPVLRKEQPGGD